MTLASMRRLIDSDRSAAVSLLVPHPCSCTRGLSVGAFSSVRRARRLRIANGHAGCRMSRFTRGRWVSVGRTSQLSAPVNNVAVCERSTTDGTLLGPGTRPVSIHKVLRLAKREVCSRRAWAAQTGTPPRECPASKGNHGSLDQPGTHGGSSAKATRTWSSGLWKRTGETEARACSIHKVLRLCKAGNLFPPRRDRTTRTPPRECDNKQGDPWVPGTSQGPIGFLGKGSAMIRWPCLVAWPEGNDRRTRVAHVRSTSVAVLPGGALLPAPFGPHQQGPPHGSALATTGTFIGPWQQRGTPLDSSARAT